MKEQPIGSKFEVEAISLTNQEQIDLIGLILQAKEKGDAYEQNRLFQLLWGSIAKLATKILTDSYISIIQNARNDNALETMMIGAAAAVFESLNKYDPKIATFNAFVGRYILHAGHSYMAEQNGRSDANEQHSHNIKKCIQELKAKGKEINIQTLITMTGLPLATIQCVMDQDQALSNTISIHSQEYLQEIVSAEKAEPSRAHNQSPEQQVVNNEEKEKINKAFKQIDRTTALVIKYRQGYNTQSLSTTDIAEKLGITPAEVNSRYQAGIRDLQRILSKDPLFKDQTIKKNVRAFDRTLKFMPKITNTDIEDAASFMELNNVI